MNQNCIDRTSSGHNLRILTRMADITYDKRAAYVKSVCSTLTDSRFGPGRVKPIAIRLSEWPELEPAVFYEMSPAGPAPAYTFLPPSEFARRYANDIIRRQLAPPDPDRAIIHIRPDRTSDPQNRGRGSP